MYTPDTHAMEAAILAAHQAHFAGFDPAPLPALQASGAQGPVYLAARAACARMGFIAADAECLARAWQTRTDHTGTFTAAQWPVDPEDFQLQQHTAAFAPCPQQLGLYAVLPDAGWVGRMAQAGVPTVQLRFKSDQPANIDAQVRAAVAAVRGTPTRLFINDHWQAALDHGAYGVHLGQEDVDALPADAIETLRQSGLRLGISTHGYAEMLRADALAPSYIALGAVFPTTLKRMATAPQGLARLRAYAQLMRHYPLVAIGGIDATRLQAVLDCSVGSVAVVRALVETSDPETTARAWMAAMP